MKINSIRVSLIALLSVAAFLSCSTDNKPAVYNQGINITPYPLELTQGNDIFVVNKQTVIVGDATSTSVADYLSQKIQSSTGYALASVTSAPSSNFVVLSLSNDLPVNKEGYLLDVDNEQISIKAKTNAGLFYGVQTLLQLLPAEIESAKIVKNTTWSVPAVKIKDEPRFGYRGILFDEGRHFAGIDYVKKHLDMMAMYKLNKMHWHLTEDQGWRIEIKKYPKLTEMGSIRINPDGSQYGPFFYTQDQIKEVVAYAKELHIDIIPEIELPGHAVASIHAYPHLSCTGQPAEVRNIWGVSTTLYCAGKEDAFEFLQDVFDEVLELFDSEYIHIGGDEAPKSEWAKCANCQAKIKALGLKADKNHTPEQRLQSYFVQRMEKYLVSKNRKMIGWDEILEGGLAPSAIVMSWRGEAGGIAAGNMGHDVIMVPYKTLYLDYFQADHKIAPVVGIGHNVPLKSAYNYDPIPKELDKDKQHHVIGMQGNIWTEYMYNTNILEWFAYPRLLAVAETGWSAKENKDYANFEKRLDNQRVRLDMHDINYYIPLPQQKGIPSCNNVAFVDSVTLEFDSTEPVKFIYTTDGSEPSTKSKKYIGGMTFTENTTLKIRSILVSNRMSDVRTIQIVKQGYKTALTPNADTTSGLKAEYYDGHVFTIEEFAKLSLSTTEQIAAPFDASHLIVRNAVPLASELSNTALTGYLNIPADGVYYFSTDCDQFWLNDQLLISNEGEVKRHSRKDNSIALAKGKHAIKLIRLSGVSGGWVPQWDKINLSIREQNQTAFRRTKAEDFK